MSGVQVPVEFVHEFDALVSTGLRVDENQQRANVREGHLLHNEGTGRLSAVTLARSTVTPPASHRRFEGVLEAEVLFYFRKMTGGDESFIQILLCGKVGVVPLVCESKVRIRVS